MFLFLPVCCGLQGHYNAAKAETGRSAVEGASTGKRLPKQKVCVHVRLCMCAYLVAHNRAIRPCHSSHSMLQYSN